MKYIPVAFVLFLTLALGSANAYPAGHHHGGGGLSWQGYQWHVYKGGGRLGQHWDPSHVSIQGGHLVETISGGKAGGVSMHSPHGYGTWSVTYRMSRGPGKYAILLMPSGGTRPEVDFAEDKPSDSSRTLVTGTYHPLPGCSHCIHAKTSGDFTAWHTLSVTWTPSGYALKNNGKQWAFFPSHFHGQMHLDIQENAGGQGSSRLEVSSVHIG